MGPYGGLRVTGFPFLSGKKKRREGRVMSSDIETQRLGANAKSQSHLKFIFTMTGLISEKRF